MPLMKTPFNDAVESIVTNPGGSAVPNLPSSGGSAIVNSPFKDAVEDKVPSSRTGGMLPELNMDTQLDYKKPSGDTVPGKTFKLL